MNDAISRMPAELDTRAVWYGKELLDRPDWLVSLTNEDVDELASAMTATSITDGHDITAHAFRLPTLGPCVAAIQDALETGSGATLIRGFPVERFSEQEATAIFLGLVQHIGTPLSQSAAGERLFHVRDAGFSLDDPRARGPNTRKRLSFHTDRCDVIAFMCLRQARTGGDNYLVSSAALFNEVRQRRPDLLDQLMQPYYYQRHNVDLGNELPYCQQPIFSFCQGKFAASYLRVLIDRAYDSQEVPDMSARQREALDFLEQLANKPDIHVRIRQQPGDMLLLNNWVTLHRRSAFQDDPEESRRRHILRVWLSVPNSRPIDPLFRANYGATEAGAIRGGMRPSPPANPR